MIDKDRFIAGMAALSAAYGRELDRATQKLYHAILASELTTEQFERAITETIRTETYWPAPATILAKVQAPPSEAAREALATVGRLIRSRGGFRLVTHADFLALDAPTRAAVLAVGGFAEFADVTEATEAAFTRRFVAGYTKALERGSVPAAVDAAPSAWAALPPVVQPEPAR